MSDIVTPYTGVNPSLDLSSTAFDSAMEEFVPFVTGLPTDMNTAIAYLNSFMDVEWYIATTTYNKTGSTRPSFVYGSDGMTYVCTGTDVVGDNPVGSVSGNWTAITFEDSSPSSFTMPAGIVLPYAGESVPDGTLDCIGTAVSRSSYSNLYAAIGTMYGAGDGATTFNLPKYSGGFFRVVDNGAGVDSTASSRTDRGDGTTGDAIGTKQAASTIGNRVSSGSSGPITSNLENPGTAYLANCAGSVSNINLNVTQSAIRPFNFNVGACITY